ncbi:unnamed protein product, partial [Durusdinium trenchii]
GPHSQLFFVSGMSNHFRESQRAAVGMPVTFFQASLPPSPNPVATGVALVGEAPESTRRTGSVDSAHSAERFSKRTGEIPSVPAAIHAGSAAHATSQARHAPRAADTAAHLDFPFLQRGLFVAVDYDHLFVKGRQEANRIMKAANPGSDDRWTVSIEHVLNVLLLNGGQRRPVANIRIFTSMLPDTPTQLVQPDADQLRDEHQSASQNSEAHRLLSEALQVTPSVQCTSMCMLDVGSLLAARIQPGATEVQRTYCLVTGDVRYLHLARAMLSQGFDVELWSWRSELAPEFARLAVEFPGSRTTGALRIFSLDDYVARLSILDRDYAVPENRSIVIHFPVKFASAKPFVQNAQLFLDEHIPVAFETFGIIKPRSKELLVVLSPEVTELQLSQILQSSANLLESRAELHGSTSRSADLKTFAASQSAEASGFSAKPTADSSELEKENEL